MFFFFSNFFTFFLPPTHWFVHEVEFSLTSIIRKIQSMDEVKTDIDERWTHEKLVNIGHNLRGNVTWFMDPCPTFYELINLGWIILFEISLLVKVKIFKQKEIVISRQFKLLRNKNEEGKKKHSTFKTHCRRQCLMAQNFSFKSGWKRRYKRLKLKKWKKSNSTQKTDFRVNFMFRLNFKN